MSVELNRSLDHIVCVVHDALLDIGILSKNSQSLCIDVVLNLETFLNNVLFHCFAGTREISSAVLCKVSQINSLIDLSLDLVHK